MIKHKKLKLFNSQIDDLTQNKDNKKFWTYLKKPFKRKSNSPTPNNQDIPVDNILKHFKQLHSHSNSSSLPPDQISFKENLSTLEQIKDIQNVLDSPISISEIENMAKTLKPKKAPGPEKIRNEMLKTGVRFLNVVLFKLFNLILQSGSFPSSWCNGIITPVFLTWQQTRPSKL